MNLKDIFDNAENGTLTYEQFVAASGNAKFVDLTEGNYVAKQKYTDDLAARDTRITSLDETIKNRDADLSALKQQLDSVGNDSEKLATLNSQLSDLQKQYDKDTKAYQKQLREQAYEFAVKDFSNKQKFSSQAAKRDFERSMLAKNLTMENDAIIGASDFMAKYAEENADAFIVEQEAPAPAPAPHFVDSTNPGASSQAEANPFEFNFVGIRPHDEK